MLFLMILIPFTIVLVQGGYNTSICSQFYFNELYYIINNIYTESNQHQDNQTFNYCNQIQYYCSYTNQVIVGSLIVQNQTLQQCFAYQQNQIKPLSLTNIAAGIIIQYKLIPNNYTNTLLVQNSIQRVYQCGQQFSTLGCPRIDYSIIWDYFNQNQIGYTITAEVIGVIFMVFGIYIYRITIILLGASTVFVILVAIQAYILFIPSAPVNFISNVLILTGITSFFAGYVSGYFPKVGLFCMGIWLGIIVSFTLNNIAFYRINSNPANLTLWIVMPILSVSFGILVICIRRGMIIFSTSIIGAYLCLRALSFHLGAFPNEFLYAKAYKLGLVGTIQWQFYLYVISLVILTLSSSALQYWLFKKKSQAEHHNGTFDEHMSSLQNELKAERQKMLNIKQMFSKESVSKEPRRLKKQQSQENSDIEYVDDEDENEEQQQQQQKPELYKKLVNKKK